jgi:hypothetical protein
MLIEVLRPCCDWRRSCGVTSIIVYDVTTGTVDEEVHPWRCWRARMEGEPARRIVIIGFDPSRHLVFYRYRTNSDNGIIIFYNIPPLLTLQEATEFIKRKWGYKDVYVTIAKPVFDDSHLHFQHCYKPLIL